MLVFKSIILTRNMLFSIRKSIILIRQAIIVITRFSTILMLNWIVKQPALNDAEWILKQGFSTNCFDA